MLRERGDHNAAEDVRNGALAEAVRAARTIATLPDDVFEKEIDAILAAEQERVANAAVLAELLAPLLKESLATSRADESVARAAPRSPLTAAESPIAAARPKPANIADFIDDMLAHEQVAPRRAPVRRAS